MTTPLDRRGPAIALLSLALVVLPTLTRGAVIRVPQDFPLQVAVDMAAPGDTVRIAPGDYPRAVTVEKPILLEGDGDGVRVAGLSGGQARVRNLHFDAQLDPDRNRLVVATAGLMLEGCRFDGAVQGIDLQPGAGGLEVLDCRFTGQVQGITLNATSGSIRVEDSTFDQCLLAITTPLGFECEGGDRRPAVRCASGCRTLELRNCTFMGGDIQVSAGPGFEVIAEGCTFSGGRRGIQATGTRSTVIDGVFAGGDVESSALEITSGTGSMRGCTISGYAVAVRVGDGGASCGPYTDLVVGGSLETANSFSNNLVNLSLSQPEPVAAEFNHWGSLNCSAVQASIQGQQVSVILDASLSLRITCSVPVTPLSWGAIKARAGSREGTGS